MGFDIAKIWKINLFVMESWIMGMGFVMVYWIAGMEMMKLICDNISNCQNLAFEFWVCNGI